MGSTDERIIRLPATEAILLNSRWGPFHFSLRVLAERQVPLLWE